jgi:hypothetical protein
MANDIQLETVKFTAEIRAQIIEALKRKKLGIDEPLSLIDGFVNQSVTSQVTNSLIVGGTTLPMIVLVGNNTGRVYYFALKTILKD